MLRTKIEKKYIDKLSQIICGDIEADHNAADDILEELLRELGYDALAALYSGIPKWYA